MRRRGAPERSQPPTSEIRHCWEKKKRRERWDKIRRFNFFKDVSEPENSQTLPRNFSDRILSLSLFSLSRSLAVFTFCSLPLIQLESAVGIKERQRLRFWIRFLCGCSENRARENSESPSRLWTFFER